MSSSPELDKQMAKVFRDLAHAAQQAAEALDRARELLCPTPKVGDRVRAPRAKVWWPGKTLMSTGPVPDMEGVVSRVIDPGDGLRLWVEPDASWPLAHYGTVMVDPDDVEVL